MLVMNYDDISNTVCVSDFLCTVECLVTESEPDACKCRADIDKTFRLFLLESWLGHNRISNHKLNYLFLKKKLYL
jgi:hypothetical protein